MRAFAALPIQTLAALLVGGCLLPAPSAEAAEPPWDPAQPLARAMAEAEAALAQQELQVAESRYRTALLEGWLLIGTLDLATGDLEAAQSSFESAASAAAETRRAQISLATVALRSGREDEAVGLLRGVLARDPNDLPLRRTLAQALISAGRPDEAVQELEELRALLPDDPELMFTLASGYLRLDKTEMAEPLFERVLRERPMPQTKVLIGRIYRDFQEFDRARAMLQGALAEDPEARRANYYLGTVELQAAGRDGLDSALAYFERELELAPDDPLANLYLGTALAETRRFAEAIAPLELAARAAFTRVNALRFLGRSQLGLGQTETAIGTLSRALELGEASNAEPRLLSTVHYQLGLALRNQGRADEAAAHFADAERISSDSVEGERERFSLFLGDSEGGGLAADPAGLQPALEAALLERLRPEQLPALRQRVNTALVRAHLNLGLMLMRAQRFARAAELFESGVRLDPEFPQLQASLGAARFNAGQFELATEPLRRALQQPDAPTEIRRMLALAWLNTGAYDQAAELLADDPNRDTDPALAYAYGMALVRSGRAAEARPVFDRLLTRNADSPEINLLLGQAHAQEDDYDAAIRYLRRALELAPGTAEAHTALGEIYLRQGLLDDAERELAAELTHHPDDPKARFLLATVLDLNRKPNRAESLLRELLAERPDLPDARYLLGKILLVQGEAEQAAAQLEIAAELAPDDYNIRYQLGQAYQRLGRRQRAAEAFEEYRRLKNRDGGSP